MTTSEKLMLFLRLSLSLLCAVINGIDLSFNVYAVILKETFNFTQTEVEITASMSCVGFGLAFLETLITGAFGYTTTFAVTWLALTLSSGMFSLAAVYKDFFHYWPALVYLTQLCLSTGSGVAYMVVTRICLEIIPERHTGMFIGTFGSAICFGKIFFAGLFELFFADDMAGFFLCLAVLFALWLGMCYAVLFPVSRNLERKETEEGEMKSLKSAEKSTYSHLVRSPSFHMTFWTTAAFSAAGYTILHNITSIAESLGMHGSTFTIVTIMSVFIMGTRLFCGLVFDKVSTQSCGFWMLFVTFLSFAVGLVVGLFALNVTTMYLLTVLSGCGVGPAFFLPLAMLVVQFGRPTYGFVSTALYATVAVFQLSLQVTMGYLYDLRSDQFGETDHFCYGPGCFFWAFILLLSITVLSFLIQLCNYMFFVHEAAKGPTSLEGDSATSGNT